MNMADVQKLAAAAAAVLIIKKKKQQTIRKRWSKQWLLKRTEFNHINLLSELKLEPEDRFNYLSRNEEILSNDLLFERFIQPITIRRYTIILTFAVEIEWRSNNWKP